MLVAMGLKFLDRDLGPADQFDIDARQFAGEGIGLADGARHGHGRMAGKGLFDLGGVDIVTAANDQVLGAARDPQVAIGVNAAQVASAQVDVIGKEIDVLVALGIGGARVDAGVIEADLAHLVDAAAFHPVRGMAQDAHLGMGEGHADGTDLLLAIDRVAADETGRLGQAVALDQRDAGGLLETLEKLHRQRGRAREGGLHGRDIGIHRALHHRGDGRGHGDDETDLPAFHQLPEIVEHALAPVALRRREDHMRARGNGRHQDHVAGKDVEQRQRTHDVVLFREQKRVPEPAIVDQPRILVLRHLRHAGGAAGMEIGGDAVFLGILEGQPIGGLLGDLGIEVDDLGMVVGGVLGPDERHDELFQPREVAQQIDLDHMLDVGRVAHGLGHFLGHIRLGERLDRHHRLGPGFAQDGADLLGFQERVDRVRDARNAAAQKGQHRFVAVGQDIGHRIRLGDAKRAEQVRRLRDLAVKLRPGQRFGLVALAREQLVGHRVVVREFVLGIRQKLIERGGRLALGPWQFLLDSLHIREVRKPRHSSSSPFIPF